MFKEVIFFSVEEVKQVTPSDDKVVISILDPSEEYRRPSFEGFRDVLRMQFEDTYEEMKLAEDGQWPDEPSEEEHARFSQKRGHRIPTLTDAQIIVDFLAKHHGGTFDQLTLVVHCYGGISRSAAVASWAATRYWAPINCSRSVENANIRLIRLLNKAAGRI